MANSPLETQVDLLISWCEANTADSTDLREALTACGIRLGQRADQARTAELVTVKLDRSTKLVSAGKTPLMREAEVVAPEGELVVPEEP